MLPNSPAELCWQSQARPGSSFSRSDDGFVLIQLFPCDESHRPLALANPEGLTYCLHPGRGEPPGEHLALQVSHTPLPHQDTWPSPHTPDGALWGHFTTE